MKKLGICTCYDNKNYGSMLQAYATQLLIEKLDYSYEFIRYKKKKSIMFMIKSLPRLFNALFVKNQLRSLKKKISLKKNTEFAKRNSVRSKAFDRFMKERYNNLSPIYYGYEELKKGARNYDTVLVGSDQLWVPGGLASNFYNLMFVPDDIPKVSFATSFGVSKIPKYQYNRTREYINRFQYLSVREKCGKKIINNLTDKKVEVVLDPTLMFDKYGWEEVFDSKRIVKEDYIFCYFLGDNPSHREAVKKLSKDTGCTIVALQHLDEYIATDEGFADKALYDIDPSGYVNLIRNASYVCTDSFHGSVFSILHHRKFVTFNRYPENSAHSRNSRIDNLFSTLGLEERRHKGNVKGITKQIENEINYEIVDVKLEKLREKSLSYLKKALLTREENQ